MLGACLIGLALAQAPSGIAQDPSDQTLVYYNARLALREAERRGEAADDEPTDGDDD